MRIQKKTIEKLKQYYAKECKSDKIRTKPNPAVAPSAK
jgi:hypothetical protein